LQSLFQPFIDHFLASKRVEAEKAVEQILKDDRRVTVEYKEIPITKGVIDLFSLLFSIGSAFKRVCQSRKNWGGGAKLCLIR
jgi:hypothetical protein